MPEPTRTLFTETRKYGPGRVVRPWVPMAGFLIAAAVVVGLIVVLVAVAGPDHSATTTEGATDIRWQCTPFGDRVYWRAGYSDPFAVVAGGCRT